MSQPTGQKIDGSSGPSARVLVHFLIGLTAVILGGVLVQERGPARCLLPFAGFVTAGFGLSISFLALSDNVVLAVERMTAVFLKRSASTLIVFGMTIYVGSSFWPEKATYSLTKKARFEIHMLTRAVEEYKARFGSYPKSLDALAYPPDGDQPRLDSEKALLDPWERPYAYDPTGPRNRGRRPDVWTVTPDGELIGNWMSRPLRAGEIVPILGYVIALSGLVTSFLKLREQLLELTIHRAASVLHISATGLTVFGLLLFLGAALTPVPLEDNKRDLALAGTRTLTTAANLYKSRCGAFPSKKEDLVKPPDGGTPFIDPSAGTDPWGRNYDYDPAGPRSMGEHPDFWTVSPNGQLIGNWIPWSPCD
jgi:hypothetical protein